jgi:hypothetical protein
MAGPGSLIAQVLNRDFIIGQLEKIEAQLRRDIDQKREGGGPGAAGLDPSDYESAHDHVALALQQEKAVSSGQPGFVPPPPLRRRGQPWPPLDDFVFISRDPIISIAQSALEWYFQHSDSNDRIVEEAMTDDRRRGDGEVPVITDKRLDPFSITDPGWVSSLVAMGVRSLRRRHAFNPAPPAPVEIGDRARVILVGDWATGIPRAQLVANAMRTAVEQGQRENPRRPGCPPRRRLLCRLGIRVSRPLSSLLAG